MVSTMKRTVRLATLSLNKGKYDELCAIIGHYTDAKRVFVAHLRQTSLWGATRPKPSVDSTLEPRVDSEKPYGQGLVDPPGVSACWQGSVLG